MPRKTLYILITIGIIILIIIFLLPFLLKKNTDGTTSSIGETVSQFLPFGKAPEKSGFGTTPGTTTSNIVETFNETGTTTVEKIPKLRHLTSVPTAGSVIIMRERELIVDRVKRKIKEYFPRYMYRGNGHIEETQTTSLKVDKISNTTIPEVYEASFSNDGNAFVARYLKDGGDDIQTYSAILKSKTASSSNVVATSSLKDVLGIYLDLNMREIAFLPSKTKLIASMYEGGGGKINILNTDGTNKKTILSSPLREWLLNFPLETKAVISTKPSGYTNGVAYILNVTTGALQRIAGDLPGLTVLPSRDLSYLLLGNGGINAGLNVINVKDGSEVGQNLATLPEKCVWAKTNVSIFYCAIPESLPQAVYPDDWYKGKISFNDQIWKIDLKNGSSNLIASPETLVRESIDATNLDISSGDNYLTFINKKDLTLWGLTLDVPISSSTTTSTTTTIRF